MSTDNMSLREILNLAKENSKRQEVYHRDQVICNPNFRRDVLTELIPGEGYKITNFRNVSELRRYAKSTLEELWVASYDNKKFSHNIDEEELTLSIKRLR